MGTRLTGNQVVPVLIDLSNVPSGKYVTFVAGLGHLMGIVVQDSPPTDLVCEDVACYEEYECFGTSSTSASVCGSRGTCIANDFCKCNQGWGGYVCQRKCADCYLNY